MSGAGLPTPAEVIARKRDGGSLGDDDIASLVRGLVDGSWADAQVNPDTANKLTDAILTRARELRLATQAPSG